MQAQTPAEYRGEVSDLNAEWIRRFKKFADNYFMNDLKEAEYCLKDVFLLHKWTKAQQNLSPIDFVSQLEIKKFTDVDTIGSAACVGGACEITFQGDQMEDEYWTECAACDTESQVLVLDSEEKPLYCPMCGSPMEYTLLEEE